MQHLSHRGLLLSTADLGTAVAAAASDTPPQPRRPTGPPVDGFTWLTELIDAAAGTPFEEPVRRTIDMVLRTGDSRRLDTLARVADARDIFDADLLLQTLQRPHIWRNRDTPPRLAGALSRAIVSGRAPLNPELRAWVTEKRLRGALVPAFVAADVDWVAENLVAVLSDDPTTASTRLEEALAAVPPDSLRLKGMALGKGINRLTSPLREALQDVLLRAGAVEAPDDSPTGGLDLHAMPWRGEDGAWYAIPGNVEILHGPYTLTRGGERLQVNPDAAAPFRIPEARARQLQARQLDALWGVIADAARAGLAARAATAKAADLIPATPGDLFGVPTAELFRGPPDLAEAERRLPNAKRRLEEVLDEPDVKAILTSLSERFTAAAKAAKRALLDEKDD